MAGLLFVVTAASGTGKTSLVHALIQRVNHLQLSISHTTRAKRSGEQDGVHYHFTDTEHFLQAAAQGDFIEYAEVFGNYYGTNQYHVAEQLAAGEDVLLEIDWQGALQVRKLFPQAILIFILPPSVTALRERLQSRNQDSADVIEQRLKGSLTEMSNYINFDYLVINDIFEDALADLQAIIQAARLKIDQQSQRQETLLIQLLNASPL